MTEELLHGFQVNAVLEVPGRERGAELVRMAVGNLRLVANRLTVVQRVRVHAALGVGEDRCARCDSSLRMVRSSSGT